MQSLTDDEREIAIDQAHKLCADSVTPTLKRYWLDQMTNLIHARSPAAVARIEREKGLRAA
jgi:hypothetical protein